MKSVLLAGGAGYIGSHTAVELLADDIDVIIIDNLYNSNRQVIDRMMPACIRDYIHVVDLAKGHLASFVLAPDGWIAHL